MRRNYFLTSILILCTWLNALPVAAQSKSAKTSHQLDVALKLGSDPVEFVSSATRRGGEIFNDRVAKMTGGGPDISDALESQSIYFYEQLLEASKDQVSKGVEKAKEAAKKAYEELKARRGSGKTGPVKPVPPGKGPVKPAAPRKTATVNDNAPDTASRHIFRNAAYSPEDGGFQITETENDNGSVITGTETKTIDLPEATVIRTAEGKSDLTFDGKRISTGTTLTDKKETVSKIDGSKVGVTGTIEWGGSFDVCPDAEGIVRGTGRARLYKQTTINTGRQLAALTNDTVIEIKFTGYVNDAAQMTHFDLEGTSTETIFGYDRALDHGIIDDNKGFEDAKSTLIIEIKNNTAPASAATSGPNSGDIKLGPWKIQTYDQIPHKSQTRMGELLGLGFRGIMLWVDPLMRMSIKRWQGGGCVDVECVSAKPALKAGETVEITATASSKLDLSKINGDQTAFGIDSATPEKQRGEPSAVYILTAPKAGEQAYIGVTSTSKRGIGSADWSYEIPKPKRKPPVKPPPPPKHVDPTWKGSIKAVHTEKETKEAPPSGRMKYENRTKLNKWEITLDVLGTRDLSGGIVNNFHAQTEVTYTGSSYQETSYAPGKMSCGNGPIITSPETRSIEIIEKGDGKQLLLVTISVIGTRGYLSFGSPGIQAERTVIRKYKTNCAVHDAHNSSTHTDPRGVSIGSPGYEVEFQVDPASPNEIQGTKTVVNSDGSETVYSWHLTRGT
jgi:hypothetical protein